LSASRQFARPGWSCPHPGSIPEQPKAEWVREVAVIMNAPTLFRPRPRHGRTHRDAAAQL